MFFVLAKAVQIGQDFFSSPQYELIFDYHHQPETANIVTVDNTICEIPSDYVSEVKPLDVNESLALIDGMDCLNYIPASSFWGYEFCIHKHLRQYHPAAKVFTKDNQYTLGLPQNQKASIQYNQEYFIQLEWNDGTICDLSQKPRKSNINIFCGTFEKIKSIREVSTCFYELIITTPKLCKKPFIPETKVPKIKCKLDQLKDRIPFNLVQYFKHQKGGESKVIHIDAEPKVVFDSIFGNLLQNDKSDLQLLNEQLELQEQIDELLQNVEDMFKDDVVVLVDEDVKILVQDGVTVVKDEPQVDTVEKQTVAGKGMKGKENPVKSKENPKEPVPENIAAEPAGEAQPKNIPQNEESALKEKQNNNVFVFGLRQVEFRKSTGFGLIYDSFKAAEKYEPDYRITSARAEQAKASSLQKGTQDAKE
ncbi:hypothetical protein HDV06_006628 [Boothiomyces sp. JEL0866]|nr:hypothetical protein HDV06_006628 [Boothiomyces sp. JEL0866]